MSTINKLPFSNQFERGHSFNWAGDWKVGRYYYNDEYVTDFVVYDSSVVLSCRENHTATEETEPELIYDESGKVIGVDSIYWSFVLHSELPSKEDIIAILGDDLPFVKGSAPYSAKMNGSGDSSEATVSFTIAGNKQSHATAFNATAFGSSTASASGAISANSATASAQNSAAFNNAIASTKKYTFAINEGIASGEDSFASGKGSTASGARATAFGLNTTASGVEAFTRGQRTIAAGAQSIAEGLDTEAYGAKSQASGEKTFTVGASSFAFGKGYKTNVEFLISGAADTTTFDTNTEHNLQINDLIKYENKIARVIDIPDEYSFTLDKKLSSEDIEEGNIQIVTGVAYGPTSVMLGDKCNAVGDASHAEGYKTVAIGTNSHAEGYLTIAAGNGSHAEGVEYNDIGTAARADAAHAEGAGVVVKGQAAHGEGVLNVAGRTQEEAVAALADFPNLSGITEQKVAKLLGFGSHVEGTAAQALGTSSHAEGNSTQALVNATHAEGDTTIASGEAAHSEGYLTTASGNQAHAEGYNTQATANQAHVEGKKTIASAENAHAEGNTTKAVGNASHSEGYQTYAYGEVSHAEGTSSKLVSDNIAAGEDAEAYWYEDKFALAKGRGSHIEGRNNFTTGNYAHAEGNETWASGLSSHTEGEATVAVGEYSHAEGQYTFAQNKSEHAQGHYNASHKMSGTYAYGNAANTTHSIGIGTATNARKNAVEVMENGDAYLIGVGDYVGDNLKNDPNRPSVTLQDTINGIEGPYEEIEWSVLKTKRDNGTLKPGKWYRITDYVTTVVSTYAEPAQSAGHPFDIIVRADSTNKLNENAFAIQHAGDTYFTNSNLSAWIIWYCLDNDTNRFAWADSTNGKGVIYRMIDEHGNDCPYDFKNVQFKRKLNSSNQYDPDNGTDTWVYTFGAIEDWSKRSSYDSSGLIKSNVIKPYRDNFSKKYKLNDIVFLCLNISYAYNYNNIFGCDCYNMTFNSGCSNNIFGEQCNNNIFGSNCSNNAFGNYCQYNTFGNYCQYNVFGNYCQQIIFGTSLSVGSYYRFITVESSNDHIYIDGSSTDDSYWLQNIKIISGYNNQSGVSPTYQTISNSSTNQEYQTTYLRTSTGARKKMTYIDSSPYIDLSTL